MRFEERKDIAPALSAQFHDEIQIGYVARADFDTGKIGDVLRALPTPTKQQGIAFWNPSDPPGQIKLSSFGQKRMESLMRLMKKEERRPIFKCNEWTERAIATLRGQGILRVI